MTLPEPTLPQSPTVQRRRLRFELRNERDKARLTQDQVATEMDWSLSKIIRIEKGDVGVSTNDLRALMRLYGVTDKARIDGLVDLAKASRQKSWWHSYRGRLNPDLMKLIGYEAETSKIICVTGLLVPGLLQTEDYARASIVDCGPRKFDEDETDFILDIRLRRQQEVFGNRDQSPRVEVILDEGAIHRTVGGPDAMAEQLDHLLNLMERYDVSVRIVPYRAGAHPGMFGTFTILQFADPIADDVMYIDELNGLLVFRDIPDETDIYWEVLGRLQSVALNLDQSIELIRKVRDEMAS